MKIAVVGPSPVPFVIGGIENMLWGLYEQINRQTEHQAEIIKLPSRELSFWDLIEDYYQFYQLDLNHFDAVIVSKYPAWMVQHDHKIFYVAHRLRGLYDTYHLMRQPQEVPRGNRQIDKILDYMNAHPYPGQLNTFFSMLHDLKQNAGEEEAEFFEFPGPLIRKIVHYMDDFSFQEHVPGKFYSISRTVKERKEYFPADSSVDVVYLPSSSQHTEEGTYDHIFMVSRLDKPKRIDLLIKAMKYVKSDIPLYIAGTGPEEEYLKKLAGKDSRIHFLGFTSDEAVKEYYANSLVIPYFPQAEDYGLITIEAMMHKKPVITTSDAGGPTEFVRDYETGFVVECTPKAIAEKIDYLAQHREEAKRMGEKAFSVVKGITWKSVLSALLEEAEDWDRPRKKITVTSTFGIYPPQGGGQARTYNIFKEVGKWADVEIMSYTNSDKSPYDMNLAKGLREICIPRSAAHQKKIWKLEEKMRVPMSDIAELTLASETAEYKKRLQESIQKSDLVVFSHPYLYPLGKQYLDGRAFIYDAQDVEYQIKKAILPESNMKEALLENIYQSEKECCEHAAFIICCSEEDKEELQRLYHVPAEKIIVVANGVDTEKVKFTSVAEREANKARLGLSNEKIGIFMGSWHGPNLEACEVIFKIAELCSDAKFLLLGSQCQYFQNRDLPQNVAMMGLVSEETKANVFQTADFALNPMYSGSGTNLKMFDYMAGGIPIITTEFGTRGIQEKQLFHLADTVETFAREIHTFQLETENDRVNLARKYVEERFDWRVIVKALRDKLIILQ